MSFQRQQKMGPMRPGMYKKKLMQGRKGGGMGEMDRFLITVTVPGSAGAIRFVVREKELVEVVIGTVLKSYAREGRLPVLGSDLNDFLLYSAHDGSEALCPWETIGCSGSRNFLLCKKQGLATAERSDTLLTSRHIEKKGKGGWKAWLNKSLSFRISPR
ncbi:uncharacterized protein LOC110021901 [Phalaenopsis equestris]|uniref:uncharacterized protein LOC110021901 n=1 Tax=Phalaenopsis equestris TaxID=78828 RepID=UPI0009E5AF5B|nr:uncharacterized protein LOC110021901 [Phalaenopsis equestris]